MFSKSIAAAVGATTDEVLQPERVRTDNRDEWWKPTCGAFFEKQTEMKNTKEVKIGDGVKLLEVQVGECRTTTATPEWFRA